MIQLARRLLCLCSASILFAVFGLATSGCSGDGDGEGGLATVAVTRGGIERLVIATGRIEPFSKVEIRSKVDGLIKTVAVDEGDQVSKGQVIIEIDKDILESRVREARAALERARARYEQAQIEASPSEMELAQKKHERLQQLFSTGFASQQELDDAETALTVAREVYRAKQAAVSMAKAELSAIQAALDRAENELRYATIESPLDGIVLSRSVDAGAAVASVASTMGTLLMTLADVREMHFVGDVDETDIGMVRDGMPARISVESYPGKKFHGTVKRIAPLGVEKDKIMNFEVEITIEDADFPLRTNMTADAEIIIETHENALLVPQNSLRYKRSQAYVEVPDNTQEAGRRPVDVVLGISGTNFSEVLSGLKENDRVIVPAE
ncbi:MAG: efflux RND transporter periplasmic adaptor subunit [Candidatus Abyssobacteria bacterium SURF_17]|uniref:Efflux RND transporter periplasmic adaptor subunit n=1 Tax=Candidatus Abyssobacteria bacterium SURF_17 TaxID=2093361 RepID=A0A419F031_9BACT|nr:MAG: efflux RND transporter periplasmic adaptor subunit [Candidatus Abyssubacteria bacterium SURF_17]